MAKKKVSEKASDGMAMSKAGIEKKDSAGDPVAHNSHGKGESGLARVLEPAKNADEFGKGTVGKPGELEGIQKEGDEGLGATSLLYGGGYFEREAADLEDGVSMRETIDPDSTEPNYNYDIDPLTGSAPERKIGRSNNYDVKGKRGNTFSVGEN